MAELFFDPVLGNNANPGTVSQPKQTLGEVVTQMAAGNIIRLRAGHRFPLTASGGLSITGKTLTSLCLIKPYDDDKFETKPLIDMLYYEAANATGWTSLGDGRWQKNMPAQAMRVWEATTPSTVQFGVFGNDKARVADAASVNTVHKFHCGSGSPFTMTMFTGSTTKAPPQHFEGLAMAGVGQATAGGLVMRRSKMLQWEDIVTAGGSNAWQILTENASVNNSEDITLVRCEAWAVMQSGSGFHCTGNDTTLTWKNLRTKLLECIYDGKRTSYGWEKDSANWASNNGFNINGAVKDIVIRNPVSKGAGHSEIQAQNDGTTGQRLIEGLHIYGTGGALVDSSTTDYAHAFDICADGYLIDNVKVVGQTGCSQFGGAGVVRNCTWLNNRENLQFPLTTASQNSQGKNNCVMVQNFSSPDYRFVTDITFEGNLIVNPVNYAFYVHFMPTSPATMAANAVKFRNNTIVDLTPHATRTTSIRMYDDASSAPTHPDHTFENNLFITPLTNVISRESGSNANYVNYTENGYTGAAGNMKFTSLSAAGLDATYQPSALSAAYRAGVSRKAGVDRNGVRRWHPPTVGAFEVSPVRTSRT